MHEPIDWGANPINALFRLIEFSDNGEPLPPEMIKWLADGAREFLSNHRGTTIGKALGIESGGRGQVTAMTSWREATAEMIAMFNLARLVDLGATHEQAASLVHERMVKEDKGSALAVETLKQAYSRSKLSKLQRRGDVGGKQMSLAEVRSFLAEFPAARRDSQAGKRRVLGLYSK